MKHFADILTSARIVLSATLLFLPPFSAAFFTLYAFCGLTDMLDGLAARKLGSTGRFGALLDSIADIVFVAVSIVRLLPALCPLLPSWWFYPVIAVSAIKLVSLVAGLIKFHRPCFLHTYSNKIAGGAVFLLPFFYSLSFFPIITGIASGIAFVAASDEFACILKMKEFDVNIRG